MKAEEAEENIENSDKKDTIQKGDIQQERSHK